MIGEQVWCVTLRKYICQLNNDLMLFIFIRFIFSTYYINENILSYIILVIHKKGNKLVDLVLKSFFRV